MTRNSEMRFCLLISRLAAGVENQISLDDVASAEPIVEVDRRSRYVEDDIRIERRHRGNRLEIEG